jgi:hypothetical protein
MAAIDYLSWDGDATTDPHRPSTDDLGGDDKLDDAEYPPDPVEHPTAAGWNQIVKQVAALARGAEAAKIEVRFVAGVPAIARASGPSSAIIPALFTVIDNGVGDTTITWPANTFPTHQCSPTGLTLLSSLLDLSGSVEEIVNGFRVRTRDAGAFADVGFTICIN